MPATATRNARFTCTCGVELPLRPASKTEPDLIWSCALCGNEFRGSPIRLDHEKLSRIRLVQATVLSDSLPSVDHLESVAKSTELLRAENRSPLCMPALALMVDDFHIPFGDPIALMTRDISSAGIGLVCDHPIGSTSILVILHKAGLQQMQMVTEIMWQRPLEDAWIIGGKFLRRLAKP